MNKRGKLLGAIVLVTLLATAALTSTGVGASTVPVAQVSGESSAEHPAASGQTLVAHVVLDEIALQAEPVEVKGFVQDVPADAIVAGIDVKVSGRDAPAPAVEVYVSAPAGDPVNLPLQANGELLSTAQTQHALDGAVAAGAWSVRVVPLDAALEARPVSVSLAITYTSNSVRLPQLITGGEGARAAMHRLPGLAGGQGAAPASDAEEAQNPTGVDVPQTPEGWQTIKTEGFEGSFPNSGWTVADLSNDGYERYWGRDDHKPHTGSWSAWPAKGGANGLDPQFYYYPNNMYSWMIYGPFDLSNAVDAQTVFYLWREIEIGYDWVFFGVSADNTDYYGYFWDGYAGWTEMTVGYGDWVGDSTVWVAWVFFSDNVVYDDGPFVDDITISKNVLSCGPYAAAGGLEIPDDGSWLQVPLLDRSSPAGGAVSEVYLKYLLDHPDPSQLEVQLTKVNSDVSQIVWRQGAAMEGASLGNALGLQAFSGAPAAGEWQLLIRDLVPGQQGRLTGASLRAFYAPLGPVPQVVNGPPGRETSWSLPADAAASSAPDADAVKAPAGAEEAAPQQPDAWQVIKSEGFEGTFPNTGWTVLDLSDDGCDFLWDDDDFRRHAGTWAAWPANGGGNGLDPATSNYPPNMNSWMIYGPFDLSSASDADTIFWLWRQIEVAYDALCFGVSADGTNFDGVCWDGTTDWQQMQVNYGSYVGDSSVWVAWVFQSDATVQYDGPFVDDIQIRKNVGSAGCGAILAAFDEALAGQTVRGPADGPPQLMPPHPDLLERARRGEIQLPEFVTSPIRRAERGIDQPQEPSVVPQGIFRTLAILVEFTDNPHQVGATYFDTLLFGNTFGTLPHYYDATSYGVLDIITVNLPSSIGWCTMPQTYAYYVHGENGFGAYPQNAQKLAEDAVLAANPLVNFSQYDNNSDGYVDTVFVIHAGRGAEYTGSANDIWSHSWATVNDPVVDGVTVNGYTMEPEYWVTPGDMTVGVYAHELGHALGLPDLYDTDGSSEGVGNWSLMGGGSWNGAAPGGGSPAFLDAWSRDALNYVNPTVVTSNIVGASIPAAENSQTVYRLWTNGTTGSQYFLVENRQLTGYDAALPGAGLLIWHVDEAKSGNTDECYQLNNWLCGSNHYKVAVEQADGLWDLEHGNDRGDAADPYPGSTNNRAFSVSSTPNSSSYSNSTPTQVAVTNISNSAATMTADLYVTAGSSGICDPDWTLGCGDTDNWNNGGAGSTDQVDAYSCSSWNESGPEYTYTFVPNSSGQVNVTLSNVTADLDIFVLDGATGTCSGNNCLAYGDSSATFNAAAGHPYYLVVDGYQGAISNYTINVSCLGGNNPPNVPSNPSPANGATGVNTNADLAWTGGDPDAGDTVTYDVYFEAGDSTPDTLACNDVATAACALGILAPNTHYYWQVLATDNHSATTSGPVWDFTTAGSSTMPHLSIPSNIPAAHGGLAAVPVNFTPNGNNIASLVFSVNFDHTCLSFDPTDSNADGIPDSVTFNVPAAFGRSVSYNAGDLDGELDFLIADTFPPLSALPGGSLVTIMLRADQCTPPPGSSVIAAVAFSTDPPPSFGNTTGQAVPGTTSDGSVQIGGSLPGDCNGDGVVDAGDISACVLEIFDGDGSLAGDTPGGTFPGTPGCDSNQDGLVDAGDISCTVLLIFNGPGACGAASSRPAGEPEAPTADRSTTPSEGPALAIPAQVSAAPASSVALPINFTAHGNGISSLIFSIDYEDAWLSFDPTDSDGDGIPDSVVFNLPAGFNASVSFDATDTRGELDFLIADTFPPLASLPDGALAVITLQVGNAPQGSELTVGFSNNPPPSFGTTTGQSIAGTTVDGSVLVGNCCDLNGDGQVNVVDIQMAASCTWQPIGPTCDARYDIDHDGNLDIVDVGRVTGAFMP